jgi:predicted RNA-binding Zn-ribbon protein involved in translation (DUF1610 family)
MRCSTCGETLSGSENQCPTCGAAVANVPSRSDGVPRCPRCGYSGQGISFFKKPSNAAFLGALALFSYGIGGLIFWLLRRGAVVCPNCGLRWDWIAPDRQIAARTGGGALVPSGSVHSDPPVPRSGGIRRGLGVAAALLGVLLITIGIVAFEGPPIGIGAFFGVAGSLSFWSGYRTQQLRRKAVLTGLQRSVLRLAKQTGGVLTVTDVAADLNLSMEVAEKVLEEMDDGFRVRSEVTTEGVIVYEFPEVMHRHRLEPGEPT